jgi:protoporphyrin/coproporphyrin ferrochelatase
MSSPSPAPIDSAPEPAGRSAVLLVNLGTPTAPTTAATRRYLAEFLADPRVIELPRIVWLPLLYGLILPFRAGRSAHAYRKIWGPDGSPLRVHSEHLAAELERCLRVEGAGLSVRLAMRYGSPSIAQTLRQLQAEGLRRLLVLPLYPQYSATTTASVFDAVGAELRRWRRVPELRTITDYADEPAWLEAVAESVRAHWRTQARGERLLFSFHGIPQRYVDAGDPYHDQCLRSAQQVAARLGLAPDAWQVCFQSRVGREPWLQPYTDETILACAARGLRRLDVVCPGFAVDCLETLEEIALQNAAAFVAAGGERLSYVPALNADSTHAAALATLVRRHAADWPELAGAAAVPRAAAGRADAAEFG